MNRFARRRTLGTLTLIVLCSGTWVAHSALEVSFQPVDFWSGWLLLALAVALTLFNARKKLPFLPLLSATAWMEFHAYAGLFAVFVFLLHVGFRWPDGGFETLLALVFALVAASGVLGLVLSRLHPLRLATAEQVILFDRIPKLRLQLREEVEGLLLRATGESKTSALGDFYVERLAEFFRGPRNLLLHLLGSSRPYQLLEREMGALSRSANRREREILSEIRERVRLKNDLDHQHAQQLALKSWLFVHIPLSYSLLIAVVLHVLVVFGFRGGAP